MQATVATLSGDVDVETRSGTRGLLSELAGAERAIIDLTQVRYIDSSGITELMLAYKGRDGGAEPIRLVVEKGSGVARLIELTGLSQLFAVFDSVEAARSTD